MLDMKRVREQPEVFRQAALDKRIAVDVDALLDADSRHRELLTSVETQRAELRQSSKSLGKLSANERKSALFGQRQAKADLKTLEAEESALRQEVQALALRLPMPPDPEAPVGKDDRENVELRRTGDPPSFDFDFQSHVVLGERLGIVDLSRGVRLGGTRNYVLHGDGALLEQAVLQFAYRHMLDRGFSPCSVPTLVQDACMVGTGYFPGGEEQTYRAEKDGLSLVGTSEVPLTYLHQGETLELDKLPLRRVALTPCYRREAGTYGKGTKGLFRVHQFWKVEQVVIGPADEEWSKQEHLAMLQHATEFMDALAIPYRVVNVCTGDLGLGQVQKFDVEAWMPSRENWGETHSASRFYDFQARRLNLRYRPGGGAKPLFCHTLNNTVAASPRILVAILENGQQADGSVVVPKPLRDYVGKDVIQPPA